MTLATHATDAAIERAREGQESKCPGWGDTALRFLEMYAKLHPEFLIESVRLSSIGAIEQPSKAGAWGSVVRSAVRLGIIKATGRYGRHVTPSSHSDIKPIWASLVYETPINESLIKGGGEG